MRIRGGIHTVTLAGQVILELPLIWDKDNFQGDFFWFLYENKVPALSLRTIQAHYIGRS